MGSSATGVDYGNWDWLPEAAIEMESYIGRLLTEAAVSAHDVTARAKSITSFQEKCRLKNYTDPLQEVTDTVAIRIITYSVTDRDRTKEIIRDRFAVSEDRNPGDEKPRERRGYDCHHFVISGERPEAESGWLILGGKLKQYFDTFGGLEIQIRTVASHAWAEFEHARRYKGESYAAINEQDQQTIDQLFGAASDARSALDETFIAIERVLANPSSTTPQPEHSEADSEADAEEETIGDDGSETPTPVDATTLRDFLARRFPDDGEATEEGMEFACDLVRACDVGSIEGLTRVLDNVDGEQVRRLMDTNISVTRVRRLDDELLARFGERYISDTGDLGKVRKRKEQLSWRYDRLRDKVSTPGYKIYSLAGSDCPDRLQDVRMSAASTVREVARLVAQFEGHEAAHVPGVISPADDLSGSARSKEVVTDTGDSLWVATNLNRDYAETVMDQALGRIYGRDLRVMKSGQEVASTS